MKNYQVLIPNYKPGITPADILDLIQSQFGKELEREEIHKALSKIYFETRKAIEHRNSRKLPAENK